MADWTADAACRGMAVDYGYDLFYEEEFEAAAKRICQDCNVRLDCLRDALEAGVWYGIYGGLTPRERSSHYRRWRYWCKRNDREMTTESLARWNEDAVQ